jgi:hypothetical protein
LVNSWWMTSKSLGVCCWWSARFFSHFYKNPC